MKWAIKKILWRFYAESNEGSDERAFLDDNVQKHARVAWLLVLVSLISGFGLLNTATADITTVLAATLGPVMVLGGAWFAISFGGIPAKLLDAAMDITLWMFAAFMSSLTVAMLAVCFVTHPVLWPVWLFIYIGTYVACVMYDTADGFKAGLDEAVLNHARYAVSHYKREGVNPERDDT